MWVRALEKVIHEKLGTLKYLDPLADLNMKTHTAEQLLSNLLEQVLTLIVCAKNHRKILKTRKLEKATQMQDSNKAFQKRNHMLQETLSTTSRLQGYDHCTNFN